MTVADVVEQTADEFAEILCSDQEWVDAEFEQIVSGFWDAPATTADAPRSRDAAAHPDRRTTSHPRGGPRAPEPRASIRSPP
ncbi:hypothetical protein [Leifsonia sp. Le1]|uniref:hypothetical protein n=1 Tax=Leifsonia sp. Le1 TaxID=3404918 RepID=UPI003EBD0B15